MSSVRLVITIASLAALIAFGSGAAFAEQELKVSITPGMSSDYTSDFTLDDLKSGRVEYMVSGMGKTYTVKLSEQQVQEILDGTTVMVDSMNDGSKVRVSLTVEGEPERSGW